MTDAHTQWTLITPDNLPEFGDLVLSASQVYVMRVNFHPKWTYYEWTNPEDGNWKWKAKLVPPDA